MRPKPKPTKADRPKKRKKVKIKIGDPDKWFSLCVAHLRAFAAIAMFTIQPDALHAGLVGHVLVQPKPYRDILGLPFVVRQLLVKHPLDYVHNLLNSISWSSGAGSSGKLNFQALTISMILTLSPSFTSKTATASRCASANVGYEHVNSLFCKTPHLISDFFVIGPPI